MDVVITYVNQNDRDWQEQFLSFFPNKKHFTLGRYNDIGTLKYLMRGIEQNMPFIENVYLVVSSETQIPTWINRDNVNVILHKDIIPNSLLPTFNSNVIEMYLHRIPNLSEQFIYFNDDMIPYSKCEPSDFYNNGHQVCKLHETQISKSLTNNDLWIQKLSFMTDFIYRSFGIYRTGMIIYPEHGAIPLLKSECEKIYKCFEPHLIKTYTRIRQPKSVNAYLYVIYPYLKGLVINNEISVNTLLPIDNVNHKAIVSKLKTDNIKIISLNENSDIKQEYLEEALNVIDKKLNKKCKYEK